jgi:hypothetical protein
MHNKELADRIALKELIDRVSVLGDQKDFKNQVQLFTNDAVSETWAAGTLLLKLEGRTVMEEAFDKFLEGFDIVYHFNGQQVLAINGDKATGTVYCIATLIGMEEGKKMKTTIGARYEDEYQRIGTDWLIARRVGFFDWQEKRELS